MGWDPSTIPASSILRPGLEAVFLRAHLRSIPNLHLGSQFKYPLPNYANS